MKYTRQKIDAGVFAGLLPEGGELYQQPELPKVEFKKDRITYSMTDFRLLHPLGVQAFQICINAMANTPDVKECEIVCDGDVGGDTFDIITDIVMGFSYEARKGGRNGFSMASHVITGVTREQKEGENTKLVFRFGGDFPKSVFEYCNEHMSEAVTIADLVVYAVSKEQAELREAVKRGDYE